MTCPDFAQRVEELVDGIVPRPEAEALRAHAGACVPCGEDLRHAERFRALLAGAGREAIEGEMSRRVAERAREGRSAPAGHPAGRTERVVALRPAAIAAAVLVAAAATAGWLAGTTDGAGRADLAQGAPRPVARGTGVLAGPGRTILVDDEALLAAVPGSDGERVRLDSGAAIFQVEHGRPFAVETPQGDVHVLGTLFHVAVRGDRSTSVAVLSGAVRFEPRDEGRGAHPRRTLRPGMILDVDPQGRQRVVSRALTSDFEIRIGMQEIELDVLRGEVQRLEEALAAARGPSSTEPTPPAPQAGDAAEVPWKDLGAASRRLLRFRESDNDPDALQAMSVFLAHAPDLKRITGSATPTDWPLHPAVLAHAAPSFVDALAPDASPASRRSAADAIAAAGASLARGISGDAAPTEILAERLRFFRAILDAARSSLGDAAAAEIARSLERTREGAPFRPIPMGIDPKAELLRAWTRWFDLDAEQAASAAPVVERYLASALAAQASVVERLGQAEGEAMLFPDVRLPRRGATDAAALPDAAVVEKELRRLDVKIAVAVPRAEFERAIRALLRPEQAERGFLVWGLVTLKTE